MATCAYTRNSADYQICICRFDRKKPQQVVGFVSKERVEQAITELMGQCFGTKFWPTVHDLSGVLLYHSYDAEKAGFAAVAGWKNYLLTQK